MKCEHGYKVKVKIVPESSICWDSGILDAKGKPVNDNKTKLKIIGCPVCQEIDAVISWESEHI